MAPTILEIMGLPKPEAMTGKSLLVNAPTFSKRRILLLLLDGWGYREESYGNLISQAKTPVMDSIRERYPFTSLKASGEAVGLPEGAVGNSEVGHLHIGAGRRIYSDRLRIDRAIQDGSFFENEAFLWAMRRRQKGGKEPSSLGDRIFLQLPWVGGPSSRVVDGSQSGKRWIRLYLHAMLGRRGERKESGHRYLELIEKEMEDLGLGRVVSVIGRYWSLDREENWDRIEKDLPDAGLRRGEAG